jgi:Flp pilus assembly protein TadG
LLAVTMIGLITLVALAMDIGLVAMGRNHAQNAADVAALAGVRALNGDVGNNNNYSQVAPTAEAAATVNKVMGTAITPSNLTTEIGYYAYNSTLQRFDPYFTGSKPATENWTAVRTTINTTQPTYFARVLGLNTMAVTATATSVHRPRDIALILDFSGSMRFNSLSAYPYSGDKIGSLNPDPDFPQFGHWSSMASVMQRTSALLEVSGVVLEC